MSFSFNVSFCSWMIFHYSYFLSSFSSFSSCISIFFMPFTVFYTPCAFLVKLLCSPLLQSLQSLVLHLRVPTTHVVFLFTCFLAGMSCTSRDDKPSGAAILNLICYTSWLVLAPIYTLVSGCFFCLPHLRRELMRQAVGATLVKALVVLWSSRFCWLSCDPTGKTDPEGRGQQHSSHKPLRVWLAS